MKAAQTADGETFEVIAREWFAKYRPTWTASHGEKIISRLEKDIFPWLGKKPIASITPRLLLECLRRIEALGALDTAHRAGQNCSQIFRYAVATDRAERDLYPDLRGALPPAKQKHFAAITEPKAIGELLRAIDGYQGQFVTICALKLSPMVFLRPGELRKAEWVEFDLDRAEWCIPAERMKMKLPHIVPLSCQALAVLRELHPLTGNGRYLFPSPRTPDRPLSNNGILSALRRMVISKGEMTGHGFRAMARTVLDEVLGFRADYIEHHTSIAVKDPNGRTCNRTAHLPERKK